MSKDMSESMSKECQKICQKACQKECQKICQKECQKICQKECQKMPGAILSSRQDTTRSCKNPEKRMAGLLVLKCQSMD